MTVGEYADVLARLDWHALQLSVLTVTVGAAATGAQAHAPVRAEHGGTLRDSLKGHVESNAIRGTVQTSVSYAAFMDAGTRAHVITAKHRTAQGKPGYLAFVGRGGAFVFAQTVHHPGTKPSRFMEAGRVAGQAAITDRWPALVAGWLT